MSAKMMCVTMPIIGCLMNRNRIFLSLPQQSGFEEQYIQEALETHWITTGGPNVDAFEQGLEAYLGSEVHIGA